MWVYHTGFEQRESRENGRKIAEFFALKSVHMVHLFSLQIISVGL